MDATLLGRPHSGGSASGFSSDTDEATSIIPNPSTCASQQQLLMLVKEHMAQAYGSRPENVGDGASVGNVIQFTSAAITHLPVELWTEDQLQLHGHLAQFAINTTIAEEKGLVVYRMTTEESKIMRGFGIHRDAVARDMKQELETEEKNEEYEEEIHAGQAGGVIPPTPMSVKVVHAGSDAIHRYVEKHDPALTVKKEDVCDAKSVKSMVETDSLRAKHAVLENRIRAEFPTIMDALGLGDGLDLSRAPVTVAVCMYRAMLDSLRLLSVTRKMVELWAASGNPVAKDLHSEFSPSLFDAMGADFIKRRVVTLGMTMVEGLYSFLPVGQIGFCMFYDRFVSGSSEALESLSSVLKSMSFVKDGTLDLEDIVRVREAIAILQKERTSVDYHEVTRGLVTATRGASRLEFRYGEVDWRVCALQIISDDIKRAGEVYSELEGCKILETLTVVQRKVSLFKSLTMGADASPPAPAYPVIEQQDKDEGASQHASSNAPTTRGHRGRGGGGGKGGKGDGNRKKKSHSTPNIRARPSDTALLCDAAMADLLFSEFGAFRANEITFATVKCGGCGDSLAAHHRYCGGCGVIMADRLFACPECRIVQSKYDRHGNSTGNTKCRNAFLGCSGSRGADGAREGNALTHEDFAQIHRSIQYRNAHLPVGGTPTPLGSN